MEIYRKIRFLTEEEYLNILDSLPQENQYLDDNDPNKFCCQNGSRGIMDLLLVSI